MKLHRIQVKTFVDDPAKIHLPDLIPVFHTWIQNGELNEMLIDVADYAHVPDGPGILLIAHEADFALDGSGGRPGLQYTRKRDVPGSLEAALERALSSLFRAAQLLEEDTALQGTYRFRTNELEIRFLDRLQVPNRAESLDAVREDVERVLKGLYGVADLTIESIEDDDRLPFALRVTLPENPDVSSLAQRLQVAGG